MWVIDVRCAFLYENHMHGMTKPLAVKAFMHKKSYAYRNLAGKSLCLQMRTCVISICIEAALSVNRLGPYL
jgi:hypothetical protein